MFAVPANAGIVQRGLVLAAAGWLLAAIITPLAASAEEIPPAAQPVPNWKVPGTQAVSAANRLFLTFSQTPVADSTLRLPRLVSIVRSVRWLNGSTAELSVQPEPREWLIRLTGLPASDKPVLVITLDEPPRLFQPLAPVPARADTMLLRACEAEVHGKNLRYEPQPHKNTVGYWSVTEDYAEWHCEVPADGIYDVDILQGCGTGHGGSQVEISLQDQKLPLTVVETGHFQNFIWKPLGTLTLKKSADSLLTIRCLKKQAGAVMDVRAIRLTPVGRTREMQPELAAPDQLPSALRQPDKK
ncbi:MAG: hypothetical protein RLZZ436_385 [Planctomycetota bacterium]|jgi:hypothetical protein